MTLDPFERYFHDRAALCDELSDAGHVQAACLLATAALDALAEIWLQDFPAQRRALDRKHSGKISGALRQVEFFRRFATNDPDVSRVAVVLFGEDMARRDPTNAATAEALLEPRRGRNGVLPHAHLDRDRKALLKEYPSLRSLKAASMLLEYEYGALAYTLYRCPQVHVAGRANRTHGFAKGDEIFYTQNARDHSSIGFGPRVFTRWLRQGVTAYVGHCHGRGKRPADRVDPGATQNLHLENLWHTRGGGLAPKSPRKRKRRRTK